jgi:hypothetical protein
MSLQEPSAIGATPSCLDFAAERLIIFISGKKREKSALPKIAVGN